MRHGLQSVTKIFGQVWQAAARLRRRPRVAAAFATGSAVALLGLGLWSCQSAPKPIERRLLTEAPVEPIVRVRIHNNISQARLGGPAELALRSGSAPALVVRGPLSVISMSGGLRIVEPSGTVHLLPWPVDVSANGALSAGASPSSAFIRVDQWSAASKQWERGHFYAGQLKLHPKTVPNGAAAADPRSAVLGSPPQPGRPPADRDGTPILMEIIEVLPLEQYLAGVLPAELPAGGPQKFHEHAFHTQAICARSYALHQRARAQRMSRTFDLEAGESDQAYIGAPQIPVALKAVAETRGVVLTWQGQILRAYYSSTCGGRPGSAARVWPTGAGWEFNSAAPLQAVPRDHACQHSPVYTWKQLRDVGEMSTRIREWGKVSGNRVKAMKSIASLEVEETVPTGRPSRYILTDSDGVTFPISAELLRNACNFNPVGLPPVNRETRVRSGDLEMQVQGSKVEIRGRGFGHGVGMCQYCIDGFARKNERWEVTALRFYPGAKLERAY